eukprot:TRINITY_DN13739_c0_g1_i3.p1 TRINITY_DN13739_c0_g1~~TRINITY_DN13739_c0_g1_i3.p1  ORF type:complete len:201 (+),score=19.64 TRINITY_DN13739_c0_g1_i3:572-1174(+)
MLEKHLRSANRNREHFSNKFCSLPKCDLLVAAGHSLCGKHLAAQGHKSPSQQPTASTQVFGGNVQSLGGIAHGNTQVLGSTTQSLGGKSLEGSARTGNRRPRTANGNTQSLEGSARTGAGPHTAHTVSGSGRFQPTTKIESTQAASSQHQRVLSGASRPLAGSAARSSRRSLGAASGRTHQDTRARSNPTVRATSTHPHL